MLDRIEQYDLTFDEFNVDDFPMGLNGQLTLETQLVNIKYLRRVFLGSPPVASFSTSPPVGYFRPPRVNRELREIKHHFLRQPRAAEIASSKV